MYGKSQSMIKLGSSTSRSRKEKKKITDINIELLQQLEDNVTTSKRKLRKMRDIYQCEEQEQFIQQYIEPQQQQEDEKDVLTKKEDNNEKGKFQMNDDEDERKEQERQSTLKDRKKQKGIIGNSKITQFMSKKEKNHDEQWKQVKSNKKKWTLQQLNDMKKEVIKKQAENKIIEEEKNDKIEEQTNQKEQLEMECLAKRLAYEQMQRTFQDKGQKSQNFNQLFRKKYQQIRKNLLQSYHDDQNHQVSFQIKKNEKKTKKTSDKKSTGIISIFGQFRSYDKYKLFSVLRKQNIYCLFGVDRNAEQVLIGDYIVNKLNSQIEENLMNCRQVKQIVKKGAKIIKSNQIERYIESKTGYTLAYLLDNYDVIEQNRKEINSTENRPIQIHKQTKIQNNNEKIPTNKIIYDNRSTINMNQKKLQIQVKHKKNNEMQIQTKYQQNKKMQIETKYQQNEKISYKTSYKERQKQNSIKITSQKQIKMKTDNWAQKYSPKYLHDIIGQDRRVKSLRDWLSSWQDVNINHNLKVTKQAKNWLPSGDINSKAALISGSPGLGKTTTAKLLAKQFKLQIKQFNASDIRNKLGVSMIVNDSFGLKNGLLSKSLIIMDQIDGMSSGDRGGISAIISLIKKTKIPIICICNDRNSEKIRSLAGHCLDVKFQKPQKKIVVKKIMQILRNQNLSISQKILEHFVQIFQCDLRQILINLQLTVKSNLKGLKMDSFGESNKKDIVVIMNPFQACKVLMNNIQASKMSLYQRIQLFFVDPMKVPLIIQENYLSSVSKIKQSSQSFKRIVDANDAIILSDLLDKTIHYQQEWDLLPSYGFLSSIYPTEKVSLNLGFTQFPSWFGKFSSQKKNLRLLKQLKKQMSISTLGCSSFGLKFGHCTALLEIIKNRLNDGQINETIALMNGYNLTPVILNEHLMVTQLNTNKFEISSSIKGKLTREFNKKHQQIKQNKKMKKKQIPKQTQQKDQEDVQNDILTEIMMQMQM